MVVHEASIAYLIFTVKVVRHKLKINICGKLLGR